MRITIGAVHVVVQREGEHEGAVDTSSVEGLQQFSHALGLAGFVAGVFAVQADRSGVLAVFDDVQSVRAPVAGSLVAGGAELSDRDWFRLCDKVSDAFGEPIGDFGRSVQVHRHDVEGCPVDPFKRYRGVGEPAAEAFADKGCDLGKEVVDLGGDGTQVLTYPLWILQERDPVAGAVTG